MDQPLLDQKFYQPSEDRGWEKNMRNNGTQTFYHHEKLLVYIKFCLCEVTAVAIAIIS